MKVTLIDYTHQAVDKLIYTKNTRLTLGQDTREKIANMTREEKLQELQQMAQTIPSSWEFVNYTFEILGVTRAFTHQFVRTRTGSYAQQTMRMLDMEDWTYGEGPTTIGLNRDAQEEGFDNPVPIYRQVMDYIKEGYRDLINAGAKPEDARGILPTNIHTNIIAQFSLRALSDMNRSRGGKRTQGEYRDVLEAMITEVYKVHPWAQWFINPDTLAPVQWLEDFISKLPTQEWVSKDQITTAYKQLDLIRKSL